MQPSDIWSEIQRSEWWKWLVQQFPDETRFDGIQLNEVSISVALGTLALIMLLAWYLGWQQKRRRTHTMLVAVNDATFGRCLPRSRTGAWGFAVSVEPPPERFREFIISYQPVSIIHPTDFLRLIFGGRRATLQIAGELMDAPTAELIWLRGQPPARTLGVNPGRAPWVQSRLDYIGVEYATRGTNVAGLKHIYQDMMARFAPILLTITIQRERRPHVRVVARGRIEARDVSPLITSVRGMGRAALMK